MEKASGERDKRGTKPGTERRKRPVCHCWLAQQWMRSDLSFEGPILLSDDEGIFGLTSIISFTKRRWESRQGLFRSKLVRDTQFLIIARSAERSMHTDHRKQIRHFDEPFHVHELTFSCVGRRPLLIVDWVRVEVCHAVDQAILSRNYRLFAFVLMPEHVHLIVQPRSEAASTAQLLSAIKRPSSYRIKRAMLARRPRSVEELTVRQRPGVETFRFRQEGPGFDRNLTQSKAILAAIDYLHLNPVKRGLCERAVDWEWSSARPLLLPESPRRPELPTLSPLPFDLL